MSPVDSKLLEVARERMSHEYTDSALYEMLSSTVGESSPFAGVLKHLSATENKHYEFWRKYVPGDFFAASQVADVLRGERAEVVTHYFDFWYLVEATKSAAD